MGIAIPVALTWIGFAVHGAGKQFIYDNFIINSQWRLRSNRHLLVTLETSWPMLVLCVLGVSVAIARFYRARSVNTGRCCCSARWAASIAGIAIVPAAYKQYYLMPLPIACVFAAKGLLWIVELAQERVRGRLFVGATV